MTVRVAQFADDRWYPSRADALQREVDGYLEVAPQPYRALGVVAPHAGYYYSGRVAGAVYGAVVVPDRVIVLCPNHRGIGARRAIMVEGTWRIPGRDIPVDMAAAATIRRHASWLTADGVAHSQEHSLEVQLPFLDRRNPSFSLVPICLYPQSVEECRRLGLALAAALRELPGDTLIVASSDMNHYESARLGNAKDQLAIDRVLALDPSGLHQTVRSEGITMCGVVPATAMLFAALELGASSAHLVKYEDSGDSNGDKSHVVGYAGLVVT